MPLRVELLLDRSKSMQTRWSEAVASVNAYIRSLGDAYETADAKVRVDAFDAEQGGGLSLVTLRKKVTARLCQPILTNECYPRFGTPLYDAVRFKYERLMNKQPERAALVIMTDGEEMHSRRTTKAEVRTMIADLKERGYDVVYLGASFDAMGQAHEMGIGSESVLNLSAGFYDKGVAALGARTAMYASSGATRGFTAQDRAAAAGQPVPQAPISMKPFDGTVSVGGPVAPAPNLLDLLADPSLDAVKTFSFRSTTPVRNEDGDVMGQLHTSVSSSPTDVASSSVD